ncbi:MAG: uncharacterized membrane protein YgdD (TMEM256/DUF423 family) [Pseudomonadales bacterium]|jgi:uncharacterized membrane protein YgdD (TMEM256/DUF423 family)
MIKALLIGAGLSGFIGVALGAFGAHALKAILASDMLVVYRTGVDYQFFHTLALIAVVVLALKFPAVSTWQWSGVFFLIGIIIFSGSLYALALSGIKILGAITPIGGLCFLIGWGLFTWSAYKSLASSL